MSCKQMLTSKLYCGLHSTAPAQLKPKGLILAASHSRTSRVNLAGETLVRTRLSGPIEQSRYFGAEVIRSFNFTQENVGDLRPRRDLVNSGKQKYMGLGELRFDLASKLRPSNPWHQVICNNHI